MSTLPKPDLYAHELLTNGGGLWLATSEEGLCEKAHTPGETGETVIRLYTEKTVRNLVSLKPADDRSDAVDEIIRLREMLNNSGIAGRSIARQLEESQEKTNNARTEAIREVAIMFDRIANEDGEMCNAANWAAACVWENLICAKPTDDRSVRVVPQTVGELLRALQCFDSAAPVNGTFRYCIDKDGNGSIQLGE